MKKTTALLLTALFSFASAASFANDEHKHPADAQPMQKHPAGKKAAPAEGKASAVEQKAQSDEHAASEAKTHKKHHNKKHHMKKKSDASMAK